MEFRFLNYQQTIHKELFEDFKTDTLYLFPNEASRKAAIFYAQQKIGIAEMQCYTMKSFKREIFCRGKAIVRDEIRTLLWYQSLQMEDKEFWRIDHYFQSLKQAQRFFQLWDEINEELVELKAISEILAQDPIGEQQTILWQAFQKIYHQYKKVLDQYGVIDPIFLKKISHINFEQFQKVGRICVANQFYFTKLEKWLIEQFPAEEKIVFLQLPAQCFDTTNLEVRSQSNWFSNVPKRTKNIHIITADNQWNMMHDLMNHLKQEEIREVVDFQAEKQPYFSFLSSEYFAIDPQSEQTHSKVYQFLETIHQILLQTILSNSEILVSLESMIKTLMQPLFYHYFADESTSQDEVIEWLQRAAEDNVLFLDINLEIFQIVASTKEVKDYFSRFFQWLKKILQIQTISDFQAWVDAQDGFRTQEVEDQKNILQKFYETLHDFIELEKRINIDELIHPSTEKKSIEKPKALIFLFLIMIKNRSIYAASSSNPKKIKLISLQDTRNKQYQSIAVLNVIEGNLPSSRKSPFLLTEHQRKALGLKTYEQIILREKYYFFRLIAQTEQLFLYTIQNLEENIETSSYIDEVRQQFPTLVTESRAQKISYLDWYQTLLNSLQDKQMDRIGKDFFCIPFNENDFPENNLSLSVYPCLQLFQDHYSFYWQNIARIKPKIVSISTDFESKLIGILIHDLFQAIWNRLLDVFQQQAFTHKFEWTTMRYVQDAIKQYWKHHKKWKFLSPHNFSDVYFQHVLMPFISESIEYFFYDLDKRIHLSEQKIRVLLEKRRKKALLTTLWERWNVFFRARADVIIETQTENYLIDYKSGSMRNKKNYERQMLLYEWFYYGLETNQKMQSLLYFIMDQKFYSIENSPEKREQVLDDLTNQIEQIITNGYELAEKKSSWEEVDITRRDLKRRYDES